MTVTEARTLAQQDPVPNLVARWGQLATEARSRVTALEQTLRELDKTQAQLAERDLTVSVDLGQIGNAAMAARRDLEKERPAGFSLPKAS
jgi:ABC-type transporter Mla subunit MlaD